MEQISQRRQNAKNLVTALFPGLKSLAFDCGAHEERRKLIEEEKSIADGSHSNNCLSHYCSERFSLCFKLQTGRNQSNFQVWVYLMTPLYEGSRQFAFEARTEESLNLSIVVPVFNESETVRLFVERLIEVFGKISGINLDVVFVNDGSVDNTLERLLDLQKSNQFIRVIDLSRNFGKEAALTAGLKAATGQIVVPIDVDLQDPPEIILDMIEKWREGFDVVLGKRKNRDSDSWAKQKSAEWFYRIHNKIAYPKIPENVGDFRLMDRMVVDALNELPESRRFMKGLFAWVGFRSATVEYDRPERIAGTTKFNGWRLWNLALEGVTSFSTDPLRIWTYLGGVVAVTSCIFAMFIALRVFIYGIDLPGYASLIIAITFLGGIQLIGIGILGEYLGRAYIESKRRPLYLVRRIYKAKD